MVCKKIHKFLFIIVPLAGTFFVPVDSWGMLEKRLRKQESLGSEKRQKIETKNVADNLFPEMLGQIYQYVHPLEWAHIPRVSQNWHRIFNDIDLWKILSCWQFKPLEKRERDLDGLAKLKLIFEKAPSYIKNKFHSLPENLPFQDFYTSPMVEVLKFNYIAQWIKTRKGDKASLPYLNIAAKRDLQDRNVGNPKALWKFEKTISKVILNQTENTNCLMAALGDVPKARARVMEILLSFQVYDGNISSQLFNSYKGLANVWPECREPLLLKLISGGRPDAFIPTLRAIGEGNETDIQIGDTVVSFHMKWPEAFYIIAKHNLAKCSGPILRDSDVYQNFLKAYPVGANKSGHLLISHNNVFEDPRPYWEGIQNDFPLSSGTAHAMKINYELFLQKSCFQNPNNNFSKWLQSVKDSYQEIYETTTLFPSLKYRTLITDSDKKATNAGEFIDWIGKTLVIGNFDLEIAIPYLEWARTTPYYINMNWNYRLIGKFFENRWGYKLITDGTFKEKNPQIAEKWSDQDTNYALEYFKPGQGLTIQSLRKFHRSFMQCLLTQAEKLSETNTEKKEMRCEAFKKAFKIYCSTYNIRERIAESNYENLEVKLKRFLELSPKDAELPYFFATLPLGAANRNTQEVHYLKIAAKNGSEQAKERLLLKGQKIDQTEEMIN